MIIVNKRLGETPLQALERFRAEMIEKEPAKATFWRATPMTYAGRLDPMAEGALLILIGEECKNKEKYLGLDKEYEVEIVFGISTDTYDALGLVTKTGDEKKLARLDISKYIGKFSQEYPPYSSKTVGGKQLHTLARAGELPEEMPTKEVEIYSIEKISDDPTSGSIKKISAQDLSSRITSTIDLVQGNFRQDEIKKRWQELLATPEAKNQLFYCLRLLVKCSSGTYMRSLANRIGADAGTGAFALSIKRTQLFF
ncbi:MAG: hypothetical protein WCO48_03500 [Candidatus Taylorbacteria bacterium]